MRSLENFVEDCLPNCCESHNCDKASLTDVKNCCSTIATRIENEAERSRELEKRLEVWISTIEQHFADHERLATKMPKESEQIMFDEAEFDEAEKILKSDTPLDSFQKAFDNLRAATVVSPQNSNEETDAAFIWNCALSALTDRICRKLVARSSLLEAIEEEAKSLEDWRA